MKNLNLQTEEKLGFDRVKALLAARAQTEEGKARCLELKPLSKPEALPVVLDRVAECKQLLLEHEGFALDYAYSVRSLLQHAAVPGNWLNAEDLFRLMKWLRMVAGIFSYFRSHREAAPMLYQMVNRQAWDRQLLEAMDRLLDDRGNIKDSASPKLQTMRKERARSSSDLRRHLQGLMRQAVANGWTDLGEITIRNDRMVIPLKADFKGRIKGFVHDVSQSGQTIFVEPSSALEQNNQLRQLLLQEHNEIVRLLQEISGQIRSDLERLKGFQRLVIGLDLVRAKANLAIDHDAVRPHFEPKGEETSLVTARHPLLIEKNKKEKKPVVPLSVSLRPEQRIILVSGPNAGGKSVTLKTVGLLQLMLQAGMLVPCDDASRFRWFDSLYLDIGDEQSIQSDLSTYTSHLQNMELMLRELNSSSLILMDEFGSGTDPRLGGAMAEAFLERFVETGAYGIVTTHYGNLKNFADRTPVIANAAMQFDPNTLQPTYVMEVGIPGRSYAFEIARNVGIPEEIIAAAQAKIDTGEAYSEELLLTLETQKSELETLLEENRERAIQLRRLVERNRERSESIVKQEKRTLIEAQVQAQNLINAANAKIENTIREIRESQAEKEKTRELRKELVEMLPEVPDDIREVIEEEPEPEPEVVLGAEVAVGDWVKMKDSSSYGQVLEIQGKRAVVALGEMRVTTKLKQLLKVKTPGQGGLQRSGRGSMMIDKRANVSSELSVKGFRVEQALPVVEKFIDDAVVAGLKHVSILHGKGTGALRQSIRDYLTKIPQVISTRDAHPESGGEGWTMVELE